MSVQQAEAARRALVDWFECEECEEGQMKAVTRYADGVVPLLRAALLGGASPASKELLRQSLAKRYDDLITYQKTHPSLVLGSPKDEFVASNLDNLDAQYRVRAAQALGRIGSAAALAALEEGARNPTRPDVDAAIKDALKNSTYKEQQ